MNSMNLRSLAAMALCFGLLQAFAAPPTTAGGSASAQPRIWMTVGEHRFAVTLAANEAAQGFLAQLPLTLDMPDLNGNEKHARLPKALAANASRPGTIRNGDLMLWGADTLVVFYLTFDSPYAYTRLGRIEDASALPQVLGRGQARISFTAH